LKYIIIPIVVVLLDQISKILIKQYWVSNDLFYEKINIFGDYLRLIFIQNPGIAFGIDTSNYHIYITLLTIFAAIFLSYYLYQLVKENSYESLSWSFILGGAIGNCIDRVLVLIPSYNYHGVIDFIDIGINQYRWYTFNLADASITIGLIIYIYQTCFLKLNKLVEEENTI
jgi:signal peptidase II